MDDVDFTDLLVRGQGGTPHIGVPKVVRAIGDWREIARHAQPLLQSDGVEIDEEALPDLFTSAEFSGGLKSFARQ